MERRDEHGAANSLANRLNIIVIGRHRKPYLILSNSA